ncbi:hypothetical protein BDV98DRAFT_596186 [Pterulicium gracile]|uniref:Uncharacterized protein n=1 Tax=Pterulicium gracile TaxID=1884261 RepID=A0A5C3QBW5_9AGAR|nr:hypothetical protein BDV98DRAFT_596186 [Pterula gracilis]
MFEYEGNWQEVDDSSDLDIPHNSRMGELGGEGLVSIYIVADRFHFRTRLLGEISEDAQSFPNWSISVNGDSSQESTGSIELSPGGWFNFQLQSSASTGSMRVGFGGLVHHALSNVSRIRDVTPDALIEALEDFDESELIGTDMQCKKTTAGDDAEGKASGLHRTVGTMMSIWGVSAAGHVVWYALCTGMHSTEETALSTFEA